MLSSARRFSRFVISWNSTRNTAIGASALAVSAKYSGRAST